MLGIASTTQGADTFTMHEIEVAVKRPALETSAISSEIPASTIGLLPLFKISTFVGLTSTPMTEWPALAKQAAETHPTWKIVHAADRDVFALGGDWIAQSGSIPQFPPDGLAESASGHTLAFDTASLGRWDTGLIEFLWDAKRTAVSAGLLIDGSGLPDSGREPPGHGGAPRAPATPRDREKRGMLTGRVIIGFD